MRLFPSVRRALGLGVLCVIVLPALRAEKSFTFADTPGQLPKTVVPRHYELHLQLDLAARATIGTARIEVEALQPVREFVLNTLELDILSAELLDNPARPQPLAARVDA